MTFTIGSNIIAKTRQFNIAGNKTTHYAFDLCDPCPQVPVLTLVSLDLNEMLLMVCFCQKDIFSFCPSISHKAAHAQRLPQSDARADRLRVRVLYFASVILDSDTYTSCRNPY